MPKLSSAWQTHDGTSRLLVTLYFSRKQCTHRSYPYGGLSYGWGRKRKPGHGDHLLLPQSRPDGGFQSTFCPTSMWLTRAKCGCSEEVHQITLYPSRVLKFPLSRHDHSFQGHFICSIPTWLATPMQTTPLLWHHGGSATGGGRRRVEGVYLFWGGFVAKLQGGASPLWPDTIVGTLTVPIPIEKRATTWRKDPAFTQPSSSCKVSKRQESSWNVT